MSVYLWTKRHQTHQKCFFLSVWHVWLGNALGATMACTFSGTGRHVEVQKWLERVVIQTCWLPNVLRATKACSFSTSQRPKVVRHSVLYVFTSNRASRHNGVHFFDIEWQSNRQKIARTCGNFNILTQNVLRATTACIFSTSQRPKVVRDRRVLTIFTSKCASRHNGVRFFNISTPKSGLELECFAHVHFQTCFAP